MTFGELKSAVGLLIFIGVCVAPPGRFAPAQDKPAKEPATLRDVIDAAVDEVRVYRDADAKEPARPLVVLRWANNARGSEDGMTVLYIDRGRPLAAKCLYPWDGYLVHDFELLTGERVVARLDNSVVWQPRTPGVKFADVPDAPPPEATPTRRLRQMKSLAGQFQSTLLGWKPDDTDREQLRMLPRPLYRYELTDDQVKSGPIIDGAVFAFVMGTDPESLLLLEAARDGQTSTWRYAFARRTSGELDGRHLGKVVWTAARYPPVRDERGAHFGLQIRLPPELSAGNGKRPSEPK